jgi:hypothetical protein
LKNDENEWQKMSIRERLTEKKSIEKNENKDSENVNQLIKDNSYD